MLKKMPGLVIYDVEKMPGLAIYDAVKMPSLDGWAFFRSDGKKVSKAHPDHLYCLRGA